MIVIVCVLSCLMFIVSLSLPFVLPSFNLINTHRGGPKYNMRFSFRNKMKKKAGTCGSLYGALVKPLCALLLPFITQICVFFADTLLLPILTLSAAGCAAHCLHPILHTAAPILYWHSMQLLHTVAAKWRTLACSGMSPVFVLGMRPMKITLGEKVRECRFYYFQYSKGVHAMRLKLNIAKAIFDIVRAFFHLFFVTPHGEIKGGYNIMYKRGLVLM